MATLRDIRAISFAPFGPNTPFHGGTGIDFEDTPMSKGGFGAVHRIRTVDGHAIEGSLVKVMFDEEHGEHAYTTVKLLHDKLRQRFGDGLTAEFPELLGLPFMTFRATNEDDKPVVAMAMCDLGAMGFEDMGSDAWDTTAYFREVEPLDKSLLAYQFTRVVTLLHDIGFVHADLKDKSIFINKHRVQLALIDFDSGFHPATQGAATTVGALTQWASSKLKAWIKGEKGPSQLSTEERMDEEHWAVAAGTFELLTGMAPFFFLKDSDDACIAQYLKDNTWPEVDPASPLVNPANLAYHGAVIQLLQELDQSGANELVAAFKRTFKRGYYKPAARPKTTEWKTMLGPFCTSHVAAPIISVFKGDHRTIERKEEPVVLTWEAKKQRVLFLDGHALPFAAATFTVTPRDTTTHTLKAVNDFGSQEATFTVEAVKVEPVIRFFRASKVLRDSLEPITLEWSTEHAVEVRLNPEVSIDNSTGSVEVTPEKATTYELQAFGGFGQLTTATVQVNVVVPQIDFFDWEVNLLEGIDNVDLKWRVQQAQEVQIEGIPGTHSAEGLTHVAIRTPTNYTLEAKGLFGTTSASLKAFPFPMPVIEQMRMEYPALEMTTEVNIPKIPFSLGELDRSLFSATPEVSLLEPGYLRDEMDKAWRDLMQKRGAWLLSGRAIWDKITGHNGPHTN